MSEKYYCVKANDVNDNDLANGEAVAINIIVKVVLSVFNDVFSNQ